MRIAVFFSLFIISLSYLAYHIYRRVCYIRLGKPERDAEPQQRPGILRQVVFLHCKIAEYPLSGIFHSFVLWGFMVLMLSSVSMAAAGLFAVRITWLEHPWFLFARDLSIVLLLSGLVYFTARRLVMKRLKQNWLHSSHRTYAMLILIFVIVFSELLYLAGHAVVTETFLPGAWLVAAPAGMFSFTGGPALRMMTEVSWWVHYVAVFAFLIIIPNSKYLHPVFAPFNIYLRSRHTKGALRPVSPAEAGEQKCGVSLVQDFTRKQLLDTFSCVLCGRCHRECPSERSKERLKPKRLNGFIRTYLEEQGPGLLKNKPSIKMAGELFYADFIWSCTTCGGCNDACPVFIDHLGKIIDLRRGIVSEETDIPPAMKDFFRHVEQTGNPFGRPRKTNHDCTWAAELGIPSIAEKPGAEYLLFIGCQGTFENPAQKAVAALADILLAAGVDFAILGEAEWCCGETARRMGNEPLFQKTVRKNISSWSKLGVKKIITVCPHCFNTVKNEYPQFDGNYEVIPHAVLLRDLYYLKVMFYDHAPQTVPGRLFPGLLQAGKPSWA